MAAVAMIPCAGDSAPDSFGQTDFLYGGAGNDIYVLLGDAALVKNLNEETDTVQIGYITNHALLNNLEKLALASGVGRQTALAMRWPIRCRATALTIGCLASRGMILCPAVRAKTVLMAALATIAF
jgi:hypothetical protein